MDYFPSTTQNEKDGSPRVLTSGNFAKLKMARGYGVRTYNKDQIFRINSGSVVSCSDQFVENDYQSSKSLTRRKLKLPTKNGTLNT
jgi:hypothetical protein